jgi:hypothetical protein
VGTFVNSGSFCAGGVGGAGAFGFAPPAAPPVVCAGSTAITAQAALSASASHHRRAAGIMTAGWRIGIDRVGINAAI